MTYFVLTKTEGENYEFLKFSEEEEVIRVIKAQIEQSQCAYYQTLTINDFIVIKGEELKLVQTISLEKSDRG